MEINYELLTPFAWTLGVIAVIDGVKIAVESFFKDSGEPEFTGEHEKVTAIVAAYNEEEVILKTITSLSIVMPRENILVVDDGSKDNTSRVVSINAPEVGLFTISNKGKVGAIHHTLTFVDTPYVILFDADIAVDQDFVIPTEALEIGHATAVSFNVIPVGSGKNFSNRFWTNMQKHEYAKSMEVGKRFSTVTKSVHCISGAAGLFRTDRLRTLSVEHTTIFPGEDLERTLLELAAGGDVIYSKSKVFTDVPQTFRELSRQRIVGWWPGLWRNIWLFLTLILKRKEPFRLRYELLYEVFALLTDPLKIISLILIVVTGNWQLLLFVYSVYLLLEIYLYRQVTKQTKNYITMKFLIIGVYPLYSMLQMFYRACAFFVFVYKKFFTSQWKKVVALLLAVSPLYAKTQTIDSLKKPSWTVDYAFAHINDIDKDRSFNNHQVYVGYKNFYSTISTAPYHSISLGGYFGPVLIDTRYQIKSKGLSGRIRYEHWFGNMVPHATLSYGISERVPTMTTPSYPSASIGTGYYFDKKSNIGFELSKEWGRVKGLTFSTKGKLVERSFWTTLALSVTNFGAKGGSLSFGHRAFYVQADYYQDFDFAGFDRASIGAGMKFSF